jgi:hypothetical protein
VVLAELYFVTFDGVIYRVVFGISVLDIVNDLKEVDRDSKNLATCLEDFLIFLDNGFVLFFKLDLGFGLVRICFKDLFEFGIRRVLTNFRK